MKRILGIILILTILLSSAASETLMMEPGPENGQQSGDSAGAFGSSDMAGAGTQNNGLLSVTIVSSGPYVWYFSGDTLNCADSALHQDAAGLPLASLFAEDPGRSALRENGIDVDEAASLAWLSLISRDETGVSLCLALTNPDGTACALLYDLAFSDSRIVVSDVQDMTEALGIFFDPGQNWLEITMTRLKNGVLVIGALDQEYQFHLYSCQTQEETPAEIGSEPLLTYNAAVPHDSDLLLVSYSLQDMNALELSSMNPQTGERGDPETITAGSDVTGAFCFAWNESENLLCFTIGNTAYRYTPGSGEAPVPFCIVDKSLELNRLGLIVGDQYVLYAEDGSLVWCDIHGEIKSERIRILDAAGDENLSDLSSGFNLVQTGYFSSVSSCEDVSLIPEYMLNQSADYDVYVVDMNSSVYNALKNRGFFVDLSGSETLRSAVSDLSNTVRSSVYAEDRLIALPISAQNECPALNVTAVQALTGLSREEIPTDWPGFLGLLNQLIEDGILTENPQYTVLDSGETGTDLKEALFALIMNDCMLWKSRTGTAPDDIPAALLPALRALDTVAWDSLGEPDEESSEHGWLPDQEQVSLFSIVQPEISVTNMEEGTEYWPLSLTADGTRLIAQTVPVMLINPWSVHAEGAIAFMEYFWENVDIITKMSLCQSINDPVPNTAYDEDIDYLEQMGVAYQEAIANAQSDKEAASLQQELDEMLEFLNDYRENASWLASEKSIADYRALSSQFEPAVPEFWSADEEDAAVLQYLDGMMPAEQFVTQFVSALKMALLEGE